MDTSKKMLLSVPFIVSFALINAPLAKAGELNADEVRQLVSGNTVEAISEFKRSPITWYFSPDGTFRRDRNGERESGTWQVDGDGKLCVVQTGGGGNCLTIVQDGGVWKVYKPSKKVWKGPQHNQTFNKILEGNPHNL
jgi:hypothetical protein